MWDLTGPGVEPVSFALAEGFSATGPPAKSPTYNFYICGNVGFHVKLLLLSSQPLEQELNGKNFEMLVIGVL